MHPMGQSLMPAKTTVIVFGASGDLAKTLFGLLRNSFLPVDFQIIGYARSPLDLEEFRTRVTEKIKLKTEQDHALLDHFKKRCHYMHGSYDAAESFQQLLHMITDLESQMKHSDANAKPVRIFYYALPPAMFYPVSKTLKACVYDSQATNRMIIEKPFGRDLESSNELSRQLGALFPEEELFRIDHYLGKEMVKNMMVLKFANIFFSGIWHRHYINNIQITFKEPFGTEGRGGYFDEFGIIRDVVQNHLLQVLAIAAMERPVSLKSEDVRDEKVKVLKCIPPLQMKDVLLGQYVSDGTRPGYLDDKTVPEGSNSPTYAAAVLYIENERWSGVPWILKAGKALDEQKAEIRIQFDDVPGNLFPNAARNELVIRVQPNESVYMKFMNKKPGLGMETTISELDLSYNTRYSDLQIPDAYEALILDVLKGNGSNFVRADELEAAWRIFTPVLHEIEQTKVKPETYVYGSRGPQTSSAFIKRYGFVRHEQAYVWSPRSASPNKL